MSSRHRRMVALVDGDVQASACAARPEGDDLRVADGDGVEPIEGGVVVVGERAESFEDALDQRRVAGGDGGFEERGSRRGDAKDVLAPVANASRKWLDAHVTPGSTNGAIGPNFRRES